MLGRGTAWRQRLSIDAIARHNRGKTIHLKLSALILGITVMIMLWATTQVAEAATLLPANARQTPAQDSGGVAVTTYKSNNQRTGWYNQETQLNTTNVNSNQFGKIGSFPVDGKVYAQPLYVPQVQTPVGTYNLVFVATEHDSVYAFDADGSSTQPIWHTSFLGTGVTSVPYTDVRSGDTTPEIGITGTPVIDQSTGTLYVSVMTKEGTNYYHRLHALSIADGSERPNSPVIITGSVPGNGGDSVNGTDIFEALTQNQRSALTLLNGVVYVAFASFSDQPPYHGWIMGYDATSLQQVTIFNTSPDSGKGAGIWMSGGGLAVDPLTNDIFFSTGNGDAFNLNTGGQEGSQTVYRLSTPNLTMLDYFAPFNASCLNAANSEIGSAGVMILPPQPGSHPSELLASGKEGRLYLLDRTNLGQYVSTADPCANQNQTNIDNALQEFLPTTVPGGMFGTTAYWQGPNESYVYVEGTNGTIRAYTLNNGLLSSTITSQSAESFDYPGGNVAISSKGSAAGSGILWVIAPPASCQSTDHCNPAGVSTLRAYDASDLSNELYSSSLDPSRDTSGNYVKFTTPTIANGEVFIGTEASVDVYGLLPANEVTPTPTAGGTGTATPTPTGTNTPTPTATPTGTPTPVPSNNIGITDDAKMGTSAFEANFDGGGNAYSLQGLATAGLHPGQPFIFDGVTFTWPNIGTGIADNYVADAQTLPVAANSSAKILAFLGSASNGVASGLTTITYTDGSAQSFTLTLSDWALGNNTQTPAAGDVIVSATPYRDSATGKQPIPSILFFTYVNLIAGKTVKNVSLPSFTSGGQLHVFAVGTGNSDPGAVVTPTPPPSGSQPDYWNGFTNLNGLQTNGTGVAIVNGSLRLTDGKTSEQNSVFYGNPLSIGAFSTHFLFHDTNARADGFTFAIQNQGLTALGPGGGDLGYTGISQSLAIKFDLYDNATGNATTSIGLFENGTAPDKPEYVLPGMSFQSGDVFDVVITYDGATLTVIVTDTNTGSSARQTYSVAIPTVVAGTSAYVGFTAATGGLTAVQDLQKWIFSNTPNDGNGFAHLSNLQTNGDRRHHRQWTPAHDQWNNERAHEHLL